MIIYIYIFVLGSIGLIMWSVMEYSGAGSIKVNLPHAEEMSDAKAVRKSFLSLVFPTRVLLEKFKLDVGIKMRINAGHLRLLPHEFFNLKILLIIGCSLIPYFITNKLDYYILIGAAFGYIAPDIWLNKKITARKNAIARVLPETVDLLGLCVEAGLDFTSSVKWVLDKVRLNPMMEELAFVLEEIKWGKPRTQALKDMGKRLDISEISSFVQTLVQAERMGTPVSEAFLILSEDTRMQRFHRGERIAMQAPIKILIPLIFCILPVIGIVVGGPILLQFMTNKLF
jgi:tight adherence protein C